MRHNNVQLTIDLSRYKSYYPSMIPYFDEEGNYISSTVDRPNQGHFVSDIIIPSNIANAISVQTDVHILLPNGDDDYDTPEEGNTKYASFQTLVIWYRFFKRYYDALYTVRCDGGVYQFRDTDPEYSITDEMQDLYNRLGGETTYQWLKGMLEPRYEVNGDIDLTYFYRSLTWWDIQRHIKLIEDTLAKAATLDDPASCCLRERIYDRYGGEDNFNKIYAWLRAQQAPSFNGTATKCATINIPITISRDIDAIGERLTVYEDWIPGEEYGDGTYVRYIDDVYIKQGDGKSYAFNEEQKMMEWSSGTWMNSYSQYIADSEPQSVTLSGQTESKLSEFVDTKRLYDVLGNDMMGRFLDEDSSPGPNTDNIQLDLQYHIYNVSGLEKLDIPYTFDGEKCYKVFGSIMTGITIYLQSSLGERMEEYELQWNEDAANVAQIEAFIERAQDISDINNLCDGNLYAEFRYVMGTVLSLTGDKSECHYDIDAEGQGIGVNYKDRRIIRRESETYHASTNTSYIIYYFTTEAAEKKTITNKSLNTVLTYDMCDYETVVPHNKSVDEGAMAIYAPLAGKDYKFGTASLQHVESDVYVQRGMSAALEKYILLGGIQTFEALENYQNGGLNIINSNNS